MSVDIRLNAARCWCDVGVLWAASGEWSVSSGLAVVKYVRVVARGSARWLVVLKPRSRFRANLASRAADSESSHPFIDDSHFYHDRSTSCRGG